MGYYLDRRRAAFAAHKNDAKRRSIAFQFSFDEWWAIWEASGKWDERGVRRGQYCMSRPNDAGPYATDNVRICLVGENHGERNKLWPMKGAKHPLHGKGPWWFYRTDQAVKDRMRQASIASAASRLRDERGCFLPKEHRA
jgi:hypothetical protein